MQGRTGAFGGEDREILLTSLPHTCSVCLNPLHGCTMATSSSSHSPPRKTATDLLRTTMNRFRTKKKVPEPLTTNNDALNALSQPAQVSPGLKKSGTSRWKRGKKPMEVKPAFDLTAALPSSDDFRTSLLMPNLSARFSMLREQDDPNSMLGKASDDSVLQPRRRSRMDFGGLGDIAEVSSIKSLKSQVRPPFASNGRQDSFNSEDGYHSENESSHSILSRARPGEGNILFGGRQRLYMIPKAAASSTKSLGKQVYNDDIGQSAFQKYRQEREAQQGRSSDESQGFDFGLNQSDSGDHDESHVPTPNDSARDLSHSPSMSSYERKRSTNSTSHSEARSSTAATSVASQPATSAPSPAVAPIQAPAPPPAVPSTVKRSDTKTRRLYEQGLDQHMQEQQTSALTRLNSIQRQRVHPSGKQPPPFLQSTKSASNLHEKVRQPVYALRAQSPEVPSPGLNTFAGLRSPQSSGTSPIPSGPASPTSPIDLEETNALTQALEPGDRGKATAMGAFNKPKQSFDENQYLERQRQLQRTASNAAVKREPSAPSVFQQRMGRFEEERERSDSSASARSRSRSAPKKEESTSAFNIFQRAAQMNAQPDAHQFDKSNLPDTHRTFFGDISASDSEEEEDQQPRYNHLQYGAPDYGYGTHHGRWQPTVLPSVREHPALRSQKSKASLAEEDEDEAEQPMPLNTSQSLRSLQNENTKTHGVEEGVESPVLGPGISTTPLNGLMHHLRQQSNVSSVFPNDDRRSLYEVSDPKGWNPKNLDLINPPIRNTVESDSPYTSSNPFDLEEMSTFRAGDRISRASISPIEGPRHVGHFDSRAPSRTTLLNRQSEVSELSPELVLEAEQEPEPENGNETEKEPAWQKELLKQHTRDDSTTTQQERDAFAKELAARRNAVQESMKSVVVRDNHSRDPSPAPNASGPFRGFGMLRSRPSGESIDQVPRPQGAPKAMKMLGISGGAPNTSSNNLTSHPAVRDGFSLDMARPRDRSTSRPPIPNNQVRNLQQSEEDLKRQWQQSRSREGGESRPSGQSQAGRSPASSTGGRSRANSEVATGRSRSRTGPYRDDLDKAMIEGTGSSAAGVTELSSMVPRELTPRPSPDVVQSQFEPPRPRANSRAGMTNYFDQKSLAPIQTGSKDRLTPAGPSPITLSPNVYSPAPSSSSARPSPTFPFAQNMTPPLSGTSTPLSSTFTSPPQIPQSSGRSNGPLRKKTISKGNISEPTLISATSSFDTVDLPPTASLKNGMTDEPPPVPPINPRRRATKVMFGSVFRKDSEDSLHSSSGRSKTPDPWVSRRPVESDLPFEVPRGNRSVSQTRSPRMPGPKQSFDHSPAMRQYGFAPNSGSPERLDRRSPVPPVAIEGGMF